MKSHSELLILRERILRLDLDGLTDAAVQRQFDINQLLEDFPDNEVCESMDKLLIYSMTAINSTQTLALQYIEELDMMIRKSVDHHIAIDNEYWAQNEVRFKTAEYCREYQQLKISEDSTNIIKARIGTYTDFKYPALEIGPGDGVWTDSLVACDPLYLVDYNDEFLNATKSMFNAKYQNRLRCYLTGGDKLHSLPQNQFGFVFSWNTFNYLSFNQINGYLEEIWKVLRPGGACMFSYNNIERPACARRAEDLLMSFIPKSMLCAVIRGHGFVDVKTEDVDTTVSWVEFRKPGKITSKRAGQTLGKINLVPSVKA